MESAPQEWKVKMRRLVLPASLLLALLASGEPGVAGYCWGSAETKETESSVTAGKTCTRMRAIEEATTCAPWEDFLRSSTGDEQAFNSLLYRVSKMGTKYNI